MKKITKISTLGHNRDVLNSEVQNNKKNYKIHSVMVSNTVNICNMLFYDNHFKSLFTLLYIVFVTPPMTWQSHTEVGY